MDWRIFPFQIKENYGSFEGMQDTLSNRLDDSRSEIRALITLSNKDYNVLENKRDAMDDIIETEFNHCIHGIYDFKFLSNQIIHLTFHSELEDIQNRLYSTSRRYDKHKTTFRLPPNFSGSFYILLRDLNSGFLLAPWGVPQRVEYIIHNDLTKIFSFNFAKEIRFKPENMEELLQTINNDGATLDILLVTAQVMDKDSPQRYSASVSNRGSWKKFQEYREDYASFTLDSIDCSIRYGDESLKHSVRLILRSQITNKAPLYDSLPLKTSESKKSFYKWLNKILASTFPKSN